MPVWIPPPSSKTVIFPLIEQSNAFHTEFYEPEMTNDQVSLEEINQFVSEINAEYKLYKKQVADQKSKFDFFGGLMAIIIFLNLYIFFSPFRDDFPFTNGETIILTWSFFFLICIFYDYKPKADSLSPLKDRCQDLIDKQNEILRSRDLKWHLPNEFPSWIELTKDMEKKNNHLEIPYGIPETTGTTVIFPIQCYKSDQQLPKI